MAVGPACVAAGCGGGSGGGQEACGAFSEVQRALREATVHEAPAALAAVDRGLAQLVEEATGDLAPAAGQARRAWAGYQARVTADRRDEFAVSQAHSAALRALDPFTAACGTAP